MREYTHPDVFTRGVAEGWADPQTDPRLIDWPARQAAAAIPFEVVDGHPVRPGAPTGIRHGRNELGHWGEHLAADALVMASDRDGHRWIVMVERADGHGWALPGGYVEPGEDPAAAAVRELAEETGLTVPSTGWRSMGAQLVDDPRGSDESWMVTVVSCIELGTGIDVAQLPVVVGADDARRAAWMRADSYPDLATWLADCYGGVVFQAHRDVLANTLGLGTRQANGEA